jgi:hypothetical protein
MLWFTIKVLILLFVFVWRAAPCPGWRYGSSWLRLEGAAPVQPGVDVALAPRIKILPVAAFTARTGSPSSAAWPWWSWGSAAVAGRKPSRAGRAAAAGGRVPGTADGSTGTAEPRLKRLEASANRVRRAP